MASSPELHRARLDRTARGLWLTFWWVVAILAAGALVGALGLA